MSDKSKPFVEVNSQDSSGCSTIRKPTELELKDAKKWKSIVKANDRKIAQLKAEIKLLEETTLRCPHIVCEDTYFWMYDYRACWSCGKGKGVI